MTTAAVDAMAHHVLKGAGVKHLVVNVPADKAAQDIGFGFGRCGFPAGEFVYRTHAGNRRHGGTFRTTMTFFDLGDEPLRPLEPCLIPITAATSLICRGRVVIAIAYKRTVTNRFDTSTRSSLALSGVSTPRGDHREYGSRRMVSSQL